MTGLDAIDAISLHPLGPFDLATAAALHAACFDDAWNETSIAQLTALPGSFGIVAQIEDLPVGLAIVLAVGEDAEILTLCVLPDFRRRGVASRLLAGAAEQLTSAAPKRLLLEVAEDNEDARSLYRGLGFAEVGRRPAYYRRTGAAALVLARPLHSVG